MLEYALSKIDLIEKSISPLESRAKLLDKLRTLGLADFGELIISMPNPSYPKISSILPRMARTEIQERWTGASGLTLLQQTLDFTRTAAYYYTKFTGETIFGKKILDFGCGYGRISRIMYYFTDEKNYYGVDPWKESIDLCLANGLNVNFSLSDYLPIALPVGSTRFDFIFSFSVFTHLSERATRTCLKTISDYINQNGLILITIRPIEYWDIDSGAKRSGLIYKLKETHNSTGFAFLPHDRPTVDGDVTYGDTSLTTEWLSKNFPYLEVLGVDRSFSDPYQIYVFLKKKGVG